MKLIAIISMLLLGGFIGLGVKTLGLLTSYSAYAKKWDEKSLLPSNLHLWSIVTIIAAMLMIPPMIEVGDSNAFQFLGFFAPLYLIVVGLTPEWEDKNKQHIVHTLGASVCAVAAFLWIVCVCHLWYVLIPVIALFVYLAYRTKRYDAYIFWGEMIMFLSVYVTLLIK